MKTIWILLTTTEALILAKFFSVAPVAYWSWTLVLAPIWVPLAGLVLFALVAATIALLVDT